MASTFDVIKDAVFASAKEQLQDFIDRNDDAKDFLEDRAHRIGQLGAEYLAAGGEADRLAVMADLRIVQQSIQNAVLTVALNESIQARETFMKVLSAAGAAVIKVLPVILAAI